MKWGRIEDLVEKGRRKGCNHLLSFADYGYRWARSLELHESISSNIRGTNWKVSLFTYSQILYCFHQITNTSSEMRHFHLASLPTTQWTNRLRFLLTSPQSFHVACSFHTIPHPINNPMHSTCMPINCQPIAWADVSTYQLLLSRSPSTQSNYLYKPQMQTLKLHSSTVTNKCLSSVRMLCCAT
jgi:hypothetical protein